MSGDQSEGLLQRVAAFPQQQPFAIGGLIALVTLGGMLGTTLGPGTVPPAMAITATILILIGSWIALGDIFTRERK